MRDLFDAATLHAPAGPSEALVLVLSLGAGAAAGRRMGGWPFAILLVTAQYAGFVFVGHNAIPLVAAVAAVAAAARVRPGSVNAASFLLQCGFLAGGMILYQIGRIRTESTFEPARENALRIIEFERAIGLYIEPDVQSMFMSNGTLSTVLNAYYSFGFLAFVSATLIYLFCVDRKHFALMRNAMGLSVVLAILAIALYPTAPPRLVLESGLVDTVVIEGREHAFTNEYAAIPSLHVGWMALAGLALALSMRSRWRWAVGVAPGATMTLTVMTTGNHYWIDGVIGSAFTLGSAAALMYAPRIPRPQLLPREELQKRWSLAMSRGKARFTIAGLAGLLTYLVVGQIQAPGFTDFWGFLVFQMAATLIILLAFEVAWAHQGGISWTTHIIAVTCGYLDVFGTAGDLYARIDEYDKLTHFMGVAAITSGAYDVFRAMYRSGSQSRLAEERLLAALLVGAVVGIGWEVYEFVGDKLFESKRVQGRWDTLNDLISDFLGALAVIGVMWWQERVSPEPEPSRQPARTDSGP